MHDIDLREMTFEELAALEKDVAKAKKTYTDRKKKEALAAAEAAAREHGFSLAELSNGAKAKPVSVPKYQHPENPSLTWTGRGRKPNWFTEAIESGVNESDLLIA
ncbi:H-NS family nucleoid-associated regulatory protein [Dinoroseobacter sp. S76]|uniref:H-NS histone family protein n=1 Tax=Dinoroseobacter sp. S76 TaxID=3415124 RepID=UPI003C7A1339